MAFDYGDMRTGVAIAKDGETEPLTTITADDLWPEVTSLILEHKPAQLVVGLPRNLNGDSTAQTHKAQAFASSLAQVTQLPVALQDEAMSSQRALERIGKNTPIAQRKKLLDQVAAQIILEDYFI